MTSTGTDWTRLFLIYVIEGGTILIFLAIALKLILRNRNKFTLALSGYYFSYCFGFLLNLIYLPLRMDPWVYYLHVMAIFFTIFAFVFLLIFNLNIYTRIRVKKHSLILLMAIYALSILLILTIPGAITINSDTSWTPLWTWELFTLLSIFVLSTFIVPIIILSLKIKKKMSTKSLKRKWKLHCYGIYLSSFLFMGGLLYITWNHYVFRMAWVFLSILMIVAAFLLYSGSAKGLHDQTEVTKKSDLIKYKTRLFSVSIQ